MPGFGIWDVKASSSLPPVALVKALELSRFRCSILSADEAGGN